MTVIRLFLSVFGAVSLFGDTAKAGAQYKFKLTNDLNSEVEQQQTIFDCSETIYAVLNIENLQPGEHRYQVLWKDPDGAIRERVDHNFQSGQVQTKVWAWLKFDRPAFSNVLSFLDPASGLEAFIGEWNAFVYLDGLLLEKKKLKVIC